MKSYYESRTKQKLMRRSYTVIRIDGKAFHTYTRGLIRPFDHGFIEDMNSTAEYLCKEIMGAKLAYVQSDEISVILTDFDNLNTEAWFDGTIQKITSVAASLATAKFNQLRFIRGLKEIAHIDEKTMRPNFEWVEMEDMSKKIAMFDARVFQLPTLTEVINYLVWRQQDAVRNSISSCAQCLYSHKELNGKKTDEMQEMMFQKGVNWDKAEIRKKRGAVIRKVTEVIDYKLISSSLMPDGNIGTRGEGSTRTKWITDLDTPTFTQDREYIRNLVPNNAE